MPVSAKYGDFVGKCYKNSKLTPFKMCTRLGFNFQFHYLKFDMHSYCALHRCHVLIVVFLSGVCFFALGTEPESELNTANDDEQLNLARVEVE